MVQCPVSKVGHGRSLGKGMRTEQACSDASLVYFAVSLAFAKSEALL